MTSPTSERLQFVLDTVNGGAVVNELQRIGTAGENSQTRLQQKVGDTERAFGAQGRAGGASLAVISDGANKSTSMLGRMSDRLGVTESTLRTGIATAATVGFGVLIAKAGQAVNEYVNLAGQVRDFQRASGASAAEASKFVAVLDDLQISAEQGSASIGKLARVDPAKLAAFGVEIAHAKDGTVSLTETLLNVADAYVATADPQQRALLGNAAFGRSYQELIPLLEQGRAGLDDYFGSVNAGQIYTQKQLDQAREYELALDSMQDAAADFGQVFGSTVLPALTGVLDTGADVIGFFQSLPDPIASAGLNMVVLGAAGLGLNKVLGSLAEREGAVGRLGTTLGAFGRFGAVGLAIGAAIPLIDLLKDGLKQLLGTDLDIDANRLATALEHLGRTGSSSGAFADIGGIDGFVKALDALDNQGDLESSSFMDDINGLTSLDLTDANEQLAGMDQALAQMVAGGNSEAAAASVRLLEEAALAAGYTVDDVRALLPSYAGALEDADLAQQNAAESGGELAAAAEISSEVMDRAAKAADQLRDRIQQLSGGQISLAEADIAARDAMADFTTKVQENVEAHEDNALSLDRNTQAGRDNQSALLDQIAAAQELGAATTEATGSTEAGRQAFQDQIGSIRDNMLALGFNKEQVDALIATYGKVPSSVQTTATVRDEATGQLVSITEQANGLDGRVVTLTVRQKFQIARGEDVPLYAFDPHRAGGGAVEAKREYTVGEVRAELFRPAVPGTILPNTGAASAPAGRDAPLMEVNNLVVRNDRDIDRLLDGLAWSKATS